MEYFLIFIFIITMVAWQASIDNKKYQKDEANKLNKRKEFVSKVQDIENFEISNFTSNKDHSYGIATDDINLKFCIVTSKNVKVYDYKDLLSVELIEDEESVTKTLRGNQLAGVAVGGLLLGGVGAVIGGLSGKKKSMNIINSIVLKITISDTKITVFDFVFFKRYKKDDKVELSIQESHKWYSILNAIIVKTDRSDHHETSIKEKSSTISVVDEILKLKTLMDDRVITEKEFDLLKNKLLG